MPDPLDSSPEPSSAAAFELPFIREFDDRSSLWLFEDPENLRGLLLRAQVGDFVSTVGSDPA